MIFVTGEMTFVNNDLKFQSVGTSLTFVNNNRINFNPTGVFELSDILCFHFTTNRPANVYYTLDGSDPKTSQTRFLYSDSCHLLNQNGSYTIKYYAEDGYVQTETFTKNYIITQGA